MTKEKEDIRIGVFVCSCGLNIGGVVNVKEVAEYAKKLPNVVFSCVNKYTCSDAGQQEIKEAIKKYNLNRIVVASCSPRLHETTFRKAIQEAGLNPYLLEMANIREHCSWVHMYDPKAATEKAKDAVRIAVAKARLLEPLGFIKVPVEKKVLIIGGGISGIRAALDLADMGFKVYLVEKLPSIGGVMAQLDKTFPTLDCSICIEGPLMSDVAKHPNIELITYAEVEEVEGYVGNFKVKIRKKARYVDESKCNGCGLCSEVCPVKIPNEWDLGLGIRPAIYKPFPQAVPNVVTLDKERCIECGFCEIVCEKDAIVKNDEDKIIEVKVGAIIVATGYDIYDPKKNNDFHYNDYKNVITALELERLFNASGPTQGHVVRPSDGKEPKRVAFILCVGTRDRGESSYCSGGVCCTYSLKLATMLKEKDPKKDVAIFYMDIRSIGKGFEELYTRARKLGVRFIRGRPAEIYENGDKSLRLVYENTLEGTVNEEDFDLVVLSTGMVPKNDADKIAKMLKLSKTPDGFFMEKHPKLAPVDTATDGIFLAGACQGPKDIPSSIAQARAAAMAASKLLMAGEIVLGGDIAEHIYEKCIGCGICSRVCPFGAWKIVEVTENGKKKRKAKLTPALCKGCGTCAAECPVGAIKMNHFTDEQIYSQIDAALQEKPEEKILAFLCNWCSYAGADTAGVSRLQYPANVRVIRVMCTGRVSHKFVQYAFQKGAGMVLVAGCHIGDCHYISGNVHMKKREPKIRRWMEQNGIDKERFRLEWISAAEGVKFQRVISEMAKKLEELKKKGKIAISFSLTKK